MQFPFEAAECTPQYFSQHIEQVIHWTTTAPTEMVNERVVN